MMNFKCLIYNEQKLLLQLCRQCANEKVVFLNDKLCKFYVIVIMNMKCKKN